MCSYVVAAKCITLLTVDRQFYSYTVTIMPSTTPNANQNGLSNKLSLASEEDLWSH
jgi:hypothetical protein